jgi:hypothetical protein
MPRVAILLAVSLLLGDVGLAAGVAYEWPAASERAAANNRAHVARLEARERDRCWDVAPEDATLSSCDAGERFLEALGPSDAGWVAAAEAALACRCVHAGSDRFAFHRLMSAPSSPSPADFTREERVRLLLAVRLARTSELTQVEERAHLWASIASGRPETVGGAATTFQALIAAAQSPATRDRLLAMDASDTSVAIATIALGAGDLRSHDEAARAVQVHRSLDRCVASPPCEAPLLEAGFLSIDARDAAVAALDALARTLERSMDSVRERWLEWMALQQALIELELTLPEEVRPRPVPRVRLGELDVRGSLSAREARGTLRRHLDDVESCARELVPRPRLEGQVTMQILVLPIGTVLATSVTRSTLANTALDACMREAIRRWSFPERDGASLVTTPFVLEARG